MDTTQSAQTAAPRGARVGVVRETNPDERRVALVPKIIPALLKQGVEVIVEAGAGLGALIPDEAYIEAGATLGDPYSADVVVKVAAPNDSEIAKLSSGQTLIG
ncbi:NAD(P)(+) transhydrogenase (Re/Si-specific) subunit alpha, partial [Nocardia sp. NPDC059154]